MDTSIDLLQIKIEKARTELSEESRQAIDAIDWKNVIIGMRSEKGYSFTQIEDLEIETELLLCGLLNPEDYPKELEKRMGIPKPQVNELVNEMNIKIFSKIREELVKNIKRKKTSEEKMVEEQPLEIESREEMLKHIENTDKTPSILSQKLSGAFQIPKTETEHTINNITKVPEDGKKVDPYRELPE